MIIRLFGYELTIHKLTKPTINVTDYSKSTYHDYDTIKKAFDEESKSQRRDIEFLPYIRSIGGDLS